MTVEVVENCLLEEHSIPEDQIARATGEDKELDNVDLNDSECPIRYVITVQALREGWDCPFAYVLCSVAEMRSSTAVEQILGRVMRLPKAQRKKQESLNSAYAFVASRNFYDAASALTDGLVQNGFEKQAAADLLTMRVKNAKSVNYGRSGVRDGAYLLCPEALILMPSEPNFPKIRVDEKSIE